MTKVQESGGHMPISPLMSGDFSARAELDDLFRRLPAALYRSSANGDVLAANRATAELLGYDSVEDLLAVDNVAAWSHVDPQRRQEWRRAIETSGTVHNFRQRLRRRDGEIIWVRDTALAVYDRDGVLRFYEGVLVDITAEIRASNSSSVLSGVLESTSDLVVVFDDEGTLRYANGASRAFLGLSEQDVGKMPHFENLMGGLVWQQTLELAAPRGWSGEISIPDHRGVSCPLWAVVTVHEGGDDRTYVAAIARDLSHMKRTQVRLEELVTAKDEFVATVSHELRNPLTGVMGLAEELRDRFAEFGDGERHDLITLIAHQAAEMMWLVDDLLVAARSDVGDVAVVPEAVDIIHQLSDMTSGGEHRIMWDLPPGALAAWVDPHRFRQIVRNLLSNAERHGGLNVRVRAERSGETVVVSVSDDGKGVAAADVERIFEAYQRADGAPVKQGSVGLGLSVARRLARLMGGDIEYAHDGDWATFRLSMPSADGLRVQAT